MTWLEEFKARNPKMSEADIIETYCPEDRLIVCASEDDPEGRTSMCPVCPNGETLTCEECWARRMPEKPGGLTETGPDRT